MNRTYGRSEGYLKMQLPVIEVRAWPLYDQQPTLPAPTYQCRIFNEVRAVVGRASFGISPINDRVYLYDITVAQEWRRKRYGTSFLAYLHDTYHLPITPVHIISPALGFWRELRQHAQAEGWVITQELGSDLRDEAAKRWPHLLMYKDRMKEVILHRQSVLQEPYQVATSRGLDDWNQAFPTPPWDDPPG